MDVSREIADIVGSGAASDAAVARYKDVAGRLVAGGLADQAQVLLDHLVSAGDVQALVARPSLDYLTQKIGELASQPDLKSFCLYGLEKIKQSGAFDASDATLKNHLAECYLQEDAFPEAAETLATIDISRGNFDDVYKANLNVRIAELFLDESVDDTGKADMFIRKAQQYIKAVSVITHPEIVLRFRVSFAKILDAKRNFLQAAHEYYRITTDRTARQVEDDDILDLLGKALTCAVLGKAGPQRTRVLGTLYKDLRTQALPFFGVMESMYKSRLLKTSQIESFAKTLLPHQRAQVGTTGKTVLELAVLEHNMLACSRLYNNISFAQLAELLGNVSPQEAESVCSKMIGEGRLQGTIDQVDEMLFFGTAASRDAGQTLINWDGQIGAICSTMNDITERIGAMKSSP